MFVSSWHTIELDLIISQDDFNLYNKIMRGKYSQKSEISSPTKPTFNFFPTELSAQLEVDIEAPETNFQKVLSIPKQTPIKQFRNLIHSMCETYNFQKAVIKKTFDCQLPKGLASQNRKKQAFNHYQQVIKYAHLNKERQHFSRRKFCQTQTEFSEPSIKRLAEIVEEKKNKLLVEESPLAVQRQKVSIILKDNKKRQDLFLEALLIERLQEIQSGKPALTQTDHMNKKRPHSKIMRHRRFKTEVHHELPQKLRGINPKHIRVMVNCKTEADFNRQKYVYNQRKIRFYNYAYKIEKTEKKVKKQENSSVIKAILEFNDTIGLEGAQKSNIHINRMYKLFLKYSNNQDENPQNLYNYITHQDLQTFLHDYAIDISSRPDIKSYIDEHDHLTEFNFMELLYMIGNTKNQENFDLSCFLEQRIFKNRKVPEPYPWNKIPRIKQNYAKLLKITRFNEMTEHIFKLRKTNRNSSSKLLDFNELIEILWELQLFPLNVNKKVARYMFLYGSSQPHGLNLSDFQNVLLAVGLSKKDFGKEEKRLKWILQHVSNYSTTQQVK